METFRHDVRIDRPREAVFPLAADPENQLKWDPAGMQSVQKLTPGPLQRSFRYKGRWKKFGTIDYEFAEYDPPHRFTHDARTNLGRVLHTRTFENEDGGTRFGQVLEVKEPSPLWRLLRPIRKSMTRRRMAQMAQELKGYAEGSAGSLHGARRAMPNQQDADLRDSGGAGGARAHDPGIMRYSRALFRPA